jgi:hypothetical protein
LSNFELSMVFCCFISLAPSFVGIFVISCASPTDGNALLKKSKYWIETAQRSNNQWKK